MCNLCLFLLFLKSHRTLSYHRNAKTLTSFGPASNTQRFLKGMELKVFCSFFIQFNCYHNVHCTYIILIHISVSATDHIEIDPDPQISILTKLIRICKYKIKQTNGNLVLLFISPVENLLLQFIF